MVAGLGARVWVPKDAGWAEGAVISCEGAQICVRRDEDGGKVWLDSSQAHLCNKDDVEDMTALSFLHEPGVLWNLQRRYNRCDIYTYTGSILIAVNPFKAVPALYGSELVEQYRSQERRQPHVYATACAAFQNMMRDGAGQAILVTGESGAGKTETAKLIMACLTHLGSHHGLQRSGGGVAGPSGVSGVEQKILESNPLLEAFGNAKTLRNNNSSRFGKYVEIFFDPAAGGAVTGAAVRTYLLERSRVVAVNNPERSFHIFYQLVDGASPADRAAWRLPKSAAGFAYLARSSCFELPGQSNAEEFEHTRRAMSHIGLSDQQQGAVLATVAAVLHLGNIAFQDAEDGEGAAVEGGAGRSALEAAAELLGVEPVPLAEALTTRQIQTPEGPIATPLSAQAAADARDSMAKVVYARLFDWLVAAVNAAVDEAHNGANSGGGAPGRQHLSIGLLDIYGFESFEVNDLEQLCINLTNEKLQQHFNQHVFKWEQAEYEREGVDWSYISFRDNADVLELLEGRLGLMDLLDELCRFPKATAEDLAHKYRSSPAVSANARFTRLNRPATAFGIDHYAGSVTYSTQNFLDKNRDYVVSEHQALLGRSRRPLLQELFAPDAPPAAAGEANGNGGNSSSSSSAGGVGGGSGGGALRGQSQFQFCSVSSQCRRQLAELMSALSTLQPHYVRCIKPNPSNAPGVFNAPYSLHQLRCGGVMEAVRIACAGYSYRRPFASFLEHFWQLCPEPVHALRRRAADQQSPRRLQQRQQQQQQQPHQGGCSPVGADLAALDVSDLREAAATVLAAAGLGDLAAAAGSGDGSGGPQYHLGHSKVFLRSTAAAALEGQRLAVTNAAATVIQAHFRRHQVERWYQGVRMAIVTIQAHCRGLLARREAQRRRMQRAATSIQRAWRGCVERLRFQRLRHAATVLQAVWRGVVARRSVEGVRRERAALVLQSAWRCVAVRREYLFTLLYWRAAVRIQAAWRGYSARQLYCQILPLHRAALLIQRVWREHRRGAQLAERLRSALLQYWVYSRAAVIIQAAWRGVAARRLCARLRMRQRRARFLALCNAAAKDSQQHQQQARNSPDACRRKDVCTPTSGPRKCGIPMGAGGSGCKGYGGLLGGPVRSADTTPVAAAGEVVRGDDLAHLPDRDMRVRARLAELQDFKVSPLVQYWQKQEAAAARQGRGPSRRMSGTPECGRPLLDHLEPTQGSPMSVGARSCGDLTSLPGSPMNEDVDFAIAAEALAHAVINRGRGAGRGRHPVACTDDAGSTRTGRCAAIADSSRRGSAGESPFLGSGGLSCEPSYGQLLCGPPEDERGGDAPANEDVALNAHAVRLGAGAAVRTRP